MEFFVRKGPSPDDITYVTVQDGDDTLLNLGLPGKEDSIQGWQARLVYLQGEKLEDLESLLGAVPQLLTIRVSEDAYPTYRNVLHAVFRFLEPHVSQNASMDEWAFYISLYEQLERFLFDFRAERRLERYAVAFFEAGKEEWRCPIPCDKFDEAPVQVCHAALAASHQKKPYKVRKFVENYRHFQAGVTEADPITIKVFASLSKALVDLIRRQIADLGMYVSAIPEICAFIVKNELEDVEEQKIYLGLILNSQGDEKKKSQRLDEIVQDIKQDIRRRQEGQSANPSRLDQRREHSGERLMQVISLISEHYLNRYDLDRSIGFWEKANSKDPVLRLFLVLHRRPCYLLLAQLLFLGVPSFFAYRHWSTAALSPLTLDLLDLRSIVILIWYAVLLILLFAILVQVLRRRWLYSQLLLPRLLGASVVGLAVLLLDDLPWKIGVRCSLVGWLLVALFTYLGSFLYVFIEIYNTTKFVRGRSIQDALKSSIKIYLIALSETLLIVTVASSLVFPVVNLGSSLRTGDSLGICVNWCATLIPGLMCDLLSFSFYPALVSLWTGVALFIGSFVQLMWQEKQITAPV